MRICIYEEDKIQWRNLPSSITEKTSLKSFSRALKLYLLDPEKFEKNNSNNNNQGIRVLRRAGNNYGRLADNWSGEGLVSRWDN